MWKYQQRTGRILNDAGEVIGVGYSGSSAGKNNPAMQNVKDVGPIPQGHYFIRMPQDTVTHGPYVLPLIPNPANQMFGRAGFLIHGDSVVSPGTASEGCIIQARDVRTQIWMSGDHDLQVVSGE